MRFIMFSKMLQNLSIPETADIIAKMGFEGVDLTVREKGHILPENVVAELPTAVETFEQKGLVVGMLTTSITNVTDPYAEDIFCTAAQCGVTLLKLGYWQYAGFGTIKAAIEKTRADLKGLEALAQEYGITANIHTHSGHFLTADLAICHLLVEDLDPNAIGIYVDGGHIVLEGGYGVWRQGLDLVADRIRLVAAKSMGWFPEPNDNLRAVRWTRKMLPFEKGMTDWKEFFTCLKAIPYDGFVSLHSEYTDLSFRDLIRQTESDLAHARAALAAAGG
ncbi:MAG: sugar phosphate isomerase/epimerase family protein [Candidatus Zipacnadales bacterium]